MTGGWYLILMFGLGIAGAIGQEIYLHRKYGDGPRPEKKKDPLKQVKDLAVVLLLLMVLIIVFCVTCGQT